jgi:hypothetical protein
MCGQRTAASAGRSPPRNARTTSRGGETVRAKQLAGDGVSDNDLFRAQLHHLVVLSYTNVYSTGEGSCGLLIET